MRRWLVLFCLLAVSVSALATEPSFMDSVTDAWLMIKVSAACDYTNPTTRQFAMTAAKPALSNDITITQICNIFDAIVLPHWTYFPDPYRTRFGEAVAVASDSIKIGLRGDCDDFAVLMAACIRAIGGACIIDLASYTGGGHASTRVYIGNEATANRTFDYIRQRYHVSTIFYSRDQN